MENSGAKEKRNKKTFIIEKRSRLLLRFLFLLNSNLDVNHISV